MPIQETEDFQNKVETVYYDASGIKTEDPAKAVAKVFSFTNGDRYSILCDRANGSLYNPSNSRDMDRPYRRGQSSRFAFSNVSKYYFDLYIEFLKTKENYLFSQANLYKR